ncbi:hypothetical protein [Zooshikella sp. RANM57]|uniref:hypothetical protein n=1 Tax=Zooshikella sp. RANM57 TaxID=3425863 RepID=UPI003D6DDD2B
MIEQQRQEYLKAMGITSWYSRYSLARALPSNPLLWADASPSSKAQIDAAVTETIESYEGASTTTSLPNLHGLLHTPNNREEKHPIQKQTAVLSQQLKSAINTEDNPSLNVKNTTQVESKNKVTDTSSAQSTAKVSKQPVPTFRLAICTCEDALIITDLPYSSREGFTQNHQNLLMNMLSALNWSPSLQNINIFSWPFTHQQMIDQHQQIALDALSRYLVCHYQFSDCSNVLLLGRDAAEYTLNKNKPFEQLRGLQKSSNGKQRIVVTHSVDELLKIPQYKRETWADLVTLLAE